MFSEYTLVNQMQGKQEITGVNKIKEQIRIMRNKKDKL